MIYDDEKEDDEQELKRLFIDKNIESGCKVASTLDEYIDLLNKRKNLMDKLSLYVSKENQDKLKNILDELDATYNLQSSIEFDCVLGLLFDRINMLPKLISVQSLKKDSKAPKN